MRAGDANANLRGWVSYLLFSAFRRRAKRSDGAARHVVPKGYEVIIHTLPYLKCITLVSVRSNHYPFKMF